MCDVSYLARTNGDPHITTIDGFTYTFNGVGEFIIVNASSGEFQMQGRTEQYEDENGTYNLFMNDIVILFTKQKIKSIAAVSTSAIVMFSDWPNLNQLML